VLEGFLYPDQCRNVASDWVLAFFDALDRGRPDSIATAPIWSSWRRNHAFCADGNLQTLTI